MKSDYPDTLRRQDSQVLKQALYKLNATATIISAVLIVVVAIIWWGLLNRLLSFGTSLDYSSLEALSVQNLTLLKRYNPFFWWTIIALITWLIAYVVYHFCTKVFDYNRQKIVAADVIAKLSRELSVEAKAVIFWVWQDPMHPITVGILQRSLDEIRSHRVGKMYLAQTHSELLNQHHEQQEPKN